MHQCMLHDLLRLALANYDDPLISKDYLVDLFAEDTVSFYRKASADLGFSNQKLANFVRRNWPDKPKGNSFRTYLLASIGYKFCPECHTPKAFSCYSLNKARPDNLNASCKECFSPAYKEWYKNNVQEQIQRVQKRRRNQDRSLSYEEIEFIFNRDQHKCVECEFSDEDHQILFGQRLHLDHIKPLAKGGLTCIENMQLLCRSCNSSKGIKDS